MLDEQYANQALIGLRRDAVASILMILYTLAGALRASRPLPRYLPSAALARRHLLDMMDLTEERRSAEAQSPKHGKQRWEDVYRYAYSAALTDIVGQVQQLELYTKTIVGEVGFDKELQNS